MSIPLIKIKSLKTHGLKDEIISIEAIKTRGLGQLQLTGLPDAWLRDMKEKIKCLVAQFVDWGALDRVLIHLLPAGIQKHGAHLELPIALATLAALNSDFAKKLLPFLEDHYFMGSLTLKGELIPTPESELWKNRTQFKSISPNEYQDLQSLIEDLMTEKFPRIVATNLENPKPISEPIFIPLGLKEELCWLWLSFLTQSPALLMGPPGVGKSYLAKCCEQFLHYSTIEEQGSTERIYAIANLPIPLAPKNIYPHPRAHLSEFLGFQRDGTLRPGYFALAHNGGLVLDEYCEFSRDTREILRNILDEKKYFQNTKAGQIQWPAKFFLILTCNPCPCGKALPSEESKCRCSYATLHSYQARISGPLYDRMGVKLFLSPTLKRHNLISKSIKIPETKNELKETYQAFSKESQRLEIQAESILANASFLENSSRRERALKAKLLAALLFLSSEDKKQLLRILNEQKQHESFLEQLHTRGKWKASPFGNA